MKNFVKQFCYIVFPAITAIILLILYFKQSYLRALEFDISTIIQIAGTLIGFLFTAITIFASIPKDTDYMKRFEKHKHKTIFGRCISLGIIILTICILIWLLGMPDEWIVLSFLIGLEETLFSAYYLYRLCFDNR